MIEVKRVSTDHDDFQALIVLLDKDLWARYPDTQQFFSAFNKVKLDAKAVVAYLNGEPVGCGCFRDTKDGGIVEIKRMYVKDAARGKGAAKAVLAALEKWAAEEGNRTAVLETGTNQPEAIALYSRVGYERIENYEPYVGIEESVCMKKSLS